MKKRWRNYLSLVIAVLAVAAGGFLFVAVRPVAVQVVQPQRDVPVQVFGLGTVEARVLSQIGFEAPGTLAALSADHGDRVAQGDTLARLHSSEAEARVAKARANVEQAQAGLNKARAAVGRAKAVLAQREQTNRRQQALVKQRTVSQEVADEAQLNATVAAADLAVAQSEVEVARAALHDAQAQLLLETVLLEQHTLTAPFDAVVVTRHREPGVVLNPGEPVFTLVDPASVWALAYVDEAQAGGLRVGQAAEVRLRSLPRQALAAHVVRIDIESDRVNEERRVYLKCDRCPEEFHLGEQAEVHITVATLKDALLVPETAVEGFDGVRATVWTVEDGTLQRREVTIGQRTLDGRLDIAGGLPAGAKVVAEPRPGLRVGRGTKVSNGAAP